MKNGGKELQCGDGTMNGGRRLMNQICNYSDDACYRGNTMIDPALTAIMIILGTFLTLFVIVYCLDWIEICHHVSYEKRRCNAYLNSEQYWRDIAALEKKIDTMDAIFCTYEEAR